MAPRLFIHCGLHKTATTLIQRRLGETREALAAQGLYIPRTGSWPHLRGAHHNVAFELTRFPRFHPAMGTLDELRAELSGQGGDVLISSEVFGFLLAHPGGMAPLLGLARETGRAPVVVLSLREQASYFASLYLELLKHGYRTDAGLAAEEVLETGTLRHGERLFWFDYADILERIETPVVLRNYHALEGGDPVADLLLALGQDPAPVSKAPGSRANTGATQGALARFLADRLGAEGIRAQAFLQEIEKRLAVSSRLNVDLVARIGARFAEGNARLAEGRDLVLAGHAPAPAGPGELALEAGFSFRTQRLVSTALVERFGIDLPRRPGQGRPAHVPGARLRRRFLRRRLGRVARSFDSAQIDALCTELAGRQPSAVSES